MTRLLASRRLVGVLLLAALSAMTGRVLAETPEATYNRGAFPTGVPKYENDANPSGTLQTYLPAGGLSNLSTNPFFQSLGTNGRSCATCHQPPSAMSISLANIQARYTATGGRDPLFASVDGANCPNLVSSRGQPRSAYSLLLNQGLIRIALPVPATAQFTVRVLSDPTGCNTSAAYNQTIDPATGKTLQLLSVFRRPLPAANLAFVTVSRVVPPNPTAKPFAIMWDGREGSLVDQALAATLGHAEAVVAPTTAQLNAMVAFESGVFSAQLIDGVAGGLTGAGAKGGPVALSTTTPGQQPPISTVFTQFSSWANQSGGTLSARRASIYRGQQIFDGRSFGLFNVAGITTPVGKAVPWTCSHCHSQAGEGNDPNGTLGRLGIGIGGSSQAFNGPAPSPALPLFRITCKGTATNRYLGTTMTTNDPGTALITGLCNDVEKFKTTSMRGLAARPPYFHDGSAATLADVVNVYNARFNIGLTSQDVQDLVNFMTAL